MSVFYHLRAQEDHITPTLPLLFMGKRGLAALFEAPSVVCCSFVANYLLLSELLRHLFLLTEKKTKLWLITVSPILTVSTKHWS